jgi:6-phosphogluconate dehydrogenase
VSTSSLKKSVTVDSQLSIAIIGLGKMGGNMARRLARAGILVHGHDPAAENRDYATDVQVRLHRNAAAAVKACAQPGAARVVWLMLPAGDATSAAINKIAPLLRKGDVLIDGGNANYRDSQQRGKQLLKLGLQFVDCGVSGGVWGLANGYCLMFGASRTAAKILTPYVKALAVGTDRGWLHCGPVGSGHFTKMIHNGIEYGMMQSIAEGFALLDGAQDYDLDLAATAQLWQHGSVVRSWLLDLTAQALQEPGAIDSVAPIVADSGEGRWTIDEAIRQGTPAPTIALALMSRFDSQGKADTANRLLSLMRKGFGGHATQAASQPRVVNATARNRPQRTEK